MVVCFDDLDIIVLTERSSHSAHETNEKIDAEAHIGRHENSGSARKFVDLSDLAWLPSGSPDHDRGVFLGRKLDMVKSRFRCAEFNNDALSTQLLGNVRRDGNPNPSFIAIATIYDEPVALLS